MSISTLIYGSNSESRVEEIKKSFANFKWEYNPDLKIIAFNKNFYEYFYTNLWIKFTG